MANSYVIQKVDFLHKYDEGWIRLTRKHVWEFEGDSYKGYQI